MRWIRPLWVTALVRSLFPERWREDREEAQCALVTPDALTAMADVARGRAEDLAFNDEVGPDIYLWENPAEPDHAEVLMIFPARRFVDGRWREGEWWYTHTLLGPVARDLVGKHFVVGEIVNPLGSRLSARL
jgi:hypothetical protein